MGTGDERTVDPSIRTSMPENTKVALRRLWTAILVADYRSSQGEDPATEAETGGIDAERDEEALK